MSKPVVYNWIIRIVDRNGERYETRADYTLANMRKCLQFWRSKSYVLSVTAYKQFINL